MLRSIVSSQFTLSRRMFLGQFAVFFLCFLVPFAAQIFAQRTHVVVLLNWLCFATSFFLFLFELNSMSHFWSYVSSFWNLNDLLWFIFYSLYFSSVGCVGVDSFLGGQVIDIEIKDSKTPIPKYQEVITKEEAAKLVYHQDTLPHQFHSDERQRIL